jgi:ABC-type nickel/cobalt efflux system permease component RcnA
MSFSLCLFGLILGMRHALEPDHLAAVSTLVAERRRAGSGAVLGGLWGVGHTVALLVVAALLGAAGAAMPPRLAIVFELAVAFMLIAIGIRSLVRARWQRLQTDGPMQGHGRASAHEHWPFARRSLLVGLVHGLAGSGALTALVASRLPSNGGRLFYVALFGLGSIVGMAALSGAAGWPLSRMGRHPAVARVIMTATGAFACGLGLVWGVPLVRELLG